MPDNKEQDEYFIMVGWQSLATAIITTAADDFRANRRKLHRNPDNKEAMKEIHELEKFFRSDWFCALSDVDGYYVLDQLRKEPLYGPKCKTVQKRKTPVKRKRKTA